MRRGAMKGKPDSADSEGLGPILCEEADVLAALRTARAKK